MKNHPSLIGVFGGTFDPIHLGHIEIAKRLLHDLPLTTIEFIPNAQPPHRAAPVANATDRLAMLKLATQGLKNIHINLIELQRPGPSYMVDTLRQLQKPKQILCLILGEDMLNHFEKWHQWQTILQLAHLIVINRPDTTSVKSLPSIIAENQTEDPASLYTQPAGKILFYHTDPLPYSATIIREKLAHGMIPPDWLNPQVLQYIQQHHLYGI